MAEFTLNVNGEEMRLSGFADETLLFALRNRLNLTGTKFGCGEGECGACTVLIDGKATRSCQIALGEAVHTKIITIEGLERHEVLTPVQQAFLEEGAFQCGYCTPGMILSATALLDKVPHPTQTEVVAHMNGNVCRCGTYPRILAAIHRAAAAISPHVLRSGSAEEEPALQRAKASPDLEQQVDLWIRSIGASHESA